MIRTMSDTRSPDRQLADFEYQHSAEGLFLRYARGRIAHFWHRQLMTFSGALALYLLVSPLVGLIAVSLALLGESTDLLMLRRARNALAKGGRFPTYYALTALSGGFQALTITGCVMLAAFSAGLRDANFFSFTYLAGAALNAGLVLRFHPLASQVRLVIYGCALVTILAFEILSFDTLSLQLGYDVLAVCILFYMVWMITDHFASRASACCCIARAKSKPPAVSCTNSRKLCATCPSWRGTRRIRW